VGKTKSDIFGMSLFQKRQLQPKKDIFCEKVPLNRSVERERQYFQEMEKKWRQESRAKALSSLATYFALHIEANESIYGDKMLYE